MNHATQRMWGQIMARCGFKLRQRAMPAPPDILELLRGDRVVMTFLLPDNPAHMVAVEAGLRQAIYRDAMQHPPRTSRAY